MYFIFYLKKCKNFLKKSFEPLLTLLSLATSDRKNIYNFRHSNHQAYLTK